MRISPGIVFSKQLHAASLYRSTKTVQRIACHRALHTKRLEGTNCIITGGNRGIGKAIAKLFASEGSSCTLIGRNEQTLQATVSELGDNDKSTDHSYLVGDISKPSFWNELPLPSDRRIDYLINAAGVTFSALLVRTSEDKAQGVIDTNLMGTIWACRTIGKRMLRHKESHASSSSSSSDVRGRGCIVNVSSLLGVYGGQGSAVYAASKAGVIGLTRALAAEMGSKGIRVNAMVPGYVETDMTAGKYTDAALRELEHTARPCTSTSMFHSSARLAGFMSALFYIYMDAPFGYIGSISPDFLDALRNSCFPHMQES